MRRKMAKAKVGLGYSDPFAKWSDYYYPRWTHGNHMRSKLKKLEKRRARHNMKQQLKLDCMDW